MAERHQHETGIAQDRKRQGAEKRQRNAAPPADAGEIAESLTGDQRQKCEP